jgi:hypothetical protein
MTIRTQITNLFVQANFGYDFVSEPGVFGSEHRTPRKLAPITTGRADRGEDTLPRRAGSTTPNIHSRPKNTHTTLAHGRLEPAANAACHRATTHP